MSYITLLKMCSEVLFDFQILRSMHLTFEKKEENSLTTLSPLREKSSLQSLLQVITISHIACETRKYRIAD